MSSAKKKTYEIDMCHGPILSKILLYAIPLMLSGILQLLFNAADIVVVGQFAGSKSLAAIGSTGSLTNLLVNVFIGLSIGSKVRIAGFYGAGKTREIGETVHTAISLSLISGVILAVLGIVLSKPLLGLMGTPDDVIDEAALYMRIYFVGMPAMLLYNFGSSVLRAVGDTKRPLYYLSIAGALNICLNLFFVIVFHMDSAGVALATVISQCLSAALVVRCLVRSEGAIHLSLKGLRIYKQQLSGILRIGLPAGLQSALFSIANVVLQSSVNSFGSSVMAGRAASANVEGFIYVSMNAMHQTTVSFVSQNLGGRKFDRIKKIVPECVAAVIVIGLGVGWLAILFGKQLLGIYSDDPAVVKYGMQCLRLVGATYFLDGIMEVLFGAIRGLGYSVMPMIVTLVGACGFRVLWVYTVFRKYHDLTVLLTALPVSWLLTSIAHLICLVIVFGRVKKKLS